MKARLPEDSRTSTKLLLGRHALETVSSRTLLKRTFKGCARRRLFHEPSASPYGLEALSRPECDRRLKDLPGWRGL